MSTLKRCRAPMIPRFSVMFSMCRTADSNTALESMEKEGPGIIASGNNISIRDCLVNVCANGGILLGRDLMTYGVDIDNVYFETNSVFDIRCASQYGVRYFRFSDITVRNGVARNDGMGGISRNVGYSVDLDGAKNGEITNYALLFGDPMEASISPDTSGREIKIRDSKLEKKSK